MSPRSRRALVAAVRGFYAWAHGQGLTRADLARGIPYPSAGLKLPVTLGLDSAERLLMAPDINTLQGLRDAAMLALLMGCGLRVSGLCALNESDLLYHMDRDLGREMLTVKTREKGRKERLVPAPEEARLLVRAYLGHEELEAIDRLLPDGDQVLFVSLRNRQITEDLYHGEARRLTLGSVHAMIQRYGEAVGVPKREAHPHALRHLYGTEFAESGVDLRVIQELLGHADPKTSGIYIHLASRRLRQETERANPLAKVRTPVSDLAAYLKQHPPKPGRT